MKYFANQNPTAHNPYVGPRQPLPPREWFQDFPDVLTGYDEMVRLNTAISDHANEAIACRAKADNADTDYSHAVAAALRTGEDPDGVTNKRDSYLAQATAHERLSEEAKREAAAHGYRFGALIQQVAGDIAAAAEVRLRADLAEIERIEATKRNYYADIARVWPVRRLMSTFKYTGGGLPAYYPQRPNDPREDLDTLNAEEAKVTERRAKEAHSLASMQ